MKSSKKILAIVALGCFSLGIGANNFVMSEVTRNFSLAVVDVQKVVSSSKQVNALKDEQKSKIGGLTEFVKTAKNAVEKESDPVKKKALEEKYNKELVSKKEAIEKEYVKKLSNIDSNISALIASKAKAKGYDVVLAKGVVLYGGEDITNEIAKEVK